MRRILKIWMNLFKNFNYKSYLEDNPIHDLLGLDLSAYGDIEKKVERVSIVVNMAKDSKDAKNSFMSFQKIVSQFLDLELINLGWLPNSKLITNSILSRKPFILNNKADAQLNSLLSDITSNIVRTQSFKTNSIRFFDR